VITLSMACGHTVKIGDGDGPVACPECGERRVSHVKARAPKFRGVVLGPYAQFESLTGVPVVVGVPDAE
jgi:DNA-directed RNA polymerase subunit RPC12/RpoP